MKCKKFFKVRVLALLLTLASMFFLFTACGASSEETTVNEDSEPTVSSSSENETTTSLSKRDKDKWYQTYTFFEDDDGNYFQVTYDESADGQTKLYVTNYGEEWERVYITAIAEDYVETDDDGYKYYDTGGDNSVMTFYPETLQLVLMASEYETYYCVPSEEMSIMDPYGFATKDLWWDTYSQRCTMEIEYLQNVSTGECRYHIFIEWAGDYDDENFWEIEQGSYDEAQNAIVFSDCRYYTEAYYADGTLMTTDVYTDGTGSITMDEHHRLYWNDETEGNGENCVFECSEYYDYSNIYADFIGVWYGEYEYTDALGLDATSRTVLEISAADNNSFNITYTKIANASGSRGVYEIEDIEYDEESGITFFLPAWYVTYTSYEATMSSGLTSVASYQQELVYTVTSNDGMLTLCRSGNVINILYKTGDEPTNSSNATETTSSEITESTAVESHEHDADAAIYYFVIECNSEYFTTDYFELYEFDQDMCRKARNGIYAVSGRKFDDAELQSYFEELLEDLYTPEIEPDEFSDAMLNEFQIANRDVIIEYETEQGYR